MTVKELKDALKGYNNDCEVFLVKDWGASTSGLTNIETIIPNRTML